MQKLVKIATKSLINAIGFDISKRGAMAETIEKLTSMKIEEFARFYQNEFPSSLPNIEGRYRLLSNLIGMGACEGMYIVTYLNKSLKLDGDVCEFGVGSGATSALMANEIRSSNKNIWLFDSFEGLPKPTEEDTLINDVWDLGSMELYQGQMKHPVEEVKSRLKDINFPFSRVQLVKGWVEEAIASDNLPEKICFAYVDFDFYQPIKVTLGAIRERLAVGGCIIVDDYDFFSSGCKKAVDEFMSEYGEEFSLSTPGGCKDKFTIITKLRNGE